MGFFLGPPASEGSRVQRTRLCRGVLGCRVASMTGIAGEGAVGDQPCGPRLVLWALVWALFHSSMGPYLVYGI